jgi:hypothetical protein
MDIYIAAKQCSVYSCTVSTIKWLTGKETAVDMQSFMHCKANYGNHATSRKERDHLMRGF